MGGGLLWRRLLTVLPGGRLLTWKQLNVAVRMVVAVVGVQTQVCAACRHCRLTSQGTPCGVTGGRKLTSVDYHAGPDDSGRVISPAPMRTLTIVSASGPGPEWDGPAQGRWLSDVQIVRGRACVITSTALPVGTRKSHNGTKKM